MTIKQVLKGSSLFSALDETELEIIMHLATEKQYEAGATIFQENEKAEELLVLQEGRIALQMALPRTEGQMNRRITIDVIAKDEVVGWSAIVEPYIYTFTAICLQNAKVVSINGARLRQLLADNHDVGYKVLKELIKVVGSRLNDTRQVLMSERLLQPRG